MASVEARAVQNLQNLQKMRRTTAGQRRAALGEITNLTWGAVNHSKKSKPPRVPKAKPVAQVAPQGPDQVAPQGPDQVAPQGPDQVAPQGPDQVAPQGPDQVAPQGPAGPADVSLEEAELCQAFSEALLAVQDVDEQDADRPQLCSQYVKDIYSYLRTLEVQQAVRADYMQGYEITARMRALLVDWLVQVHARFQLLQETLYLTVAIVDRFLQVHPVSSRKLQLVGVAAMLVASKYEEMYAPVVGDFAYITDHAFTETQVLDMERLLLTTLHFQLGRPLPLHFLRRASKVADSDVERHTLAKYLMELTLLDYEMVHYRPSEIAAAALCLSQLLLDGLLWSATQQHYSSYDSAHLQPVVRHIAKNVQWANDVKNKFQAVKKKYSSRALLQVSRLPQLHSAAIKTLAGA